MPDRNGDTELEKRLRATTDRDGWLRRSCGPLLSFLT
jgi:hypothetical protein